MDDRKAILARIAQDVVDVKNSTFSIRDITICMTADLFDKLFPWIGGKTIGEIKFLGCHVELLREKGLWWIVGFIGAADQDAGERG